MVWSEQSLVLLLLWVGFNQRPSLLSLEEKMCHNLSYRIQVSPRTVVNSYRQATLQLPLKKVSRCYQNKERKEDNENRKMGGVSEMDLSPLFTIPVPLKLSGKINVQKWKFQVLACSEHVFT